MEISKFTILAQIIPACIGGTCFALLHVYFAHVRNAKGQAYKYFRYYLIATSAFVLLKPFQLLATDIPSMVTVICNIRYLGLLPIGGPMFLLAAETLGERKMSFQPRYAFWVGGLFAAVYLPFNVLGHRAAATGVTANPYSRVALLTAAVFGIVFFVVPGLHRLAIWRKREQQDDRSLYFAVGALIFGISLSLSSYINIFWPLYFAALPSAMFCAYGVFIDMREFHEKYERMLPLVREELLQDIEVITDSGRKLQEILQLTGITIAPNQFLVVKLDGDSDATLSADQGPGRLIHQSLTRNIGAERFLYLPIGKNRIGICVENTGGDEGTDGVMTLAEAIRTAVEESGKGTISIGIGERYEDLRSLRQSYTEALRAQTYATRLGGNIVAFVADIQDAQGKLRYPELERGDLLQAVRQGSEEFAAKARNRLLDGLRDLAVADDDELLTSLQELAPFICEAAISGGANRRKATEFTRNASTELTGLSGDANIDNWLKQLVDFMIAEVVSAPKDRGSAITVKAKAYIKENITEKLTVDVVAKHLAISPSHFRRVFKDEVGCTFSQYATKVKCDMAKDLLTNPDHSIGDVAMELGFSDSNYFSTVFRKTTGMSPREFRNSLS